jgi:serine/threonine protein phosphatase PrpC
MSRSIGDRIAHTVGVTCTPEINETILASNDKIIVIGSDGIWEFLSNEDVADIVYPHFLKG